jgi:hypothetical protein
VEKLGGAIFQAFSHENRLFYSLNMAKVWTNNLIYFEKIIIHKVEELWKDTENIIQYKNTVR